MKKFNFVYLFILMLSLKGLTCKTMEEQSAAAELAREMADVVFKQACKKLDQHIQELRKNGDTIAQQLIEVQVKLALVGVNEDQLSDFIKAISERDWTKLINLFAEIDIAKEQDKNDEIILEMLGKAFKKIIEHVLEFEKENNPLATKLTRVISKIKDEGMNSDQEAKLINAVNAEDWDAIINLYND